MVQKHHSGALQEMATHGLRIHPTEPEYLTCCHHVRKGNPICWPGVEALEKHFDARRKQIYDEWRCQNAGERMATIEEICPSIDAPLTGVWADPEPLHRDPMAMPRDPMAMPSPTVAASSSRDPMAMPSPTAAASSSQSSSS